MSVIERYRQFYGHEKDSNRKTLEMLRSVPEDRRGDPRYARALVLAAHLVACRENWLEMMAGKGSAKTAWWPEFASLEELETRYAAAEEAWTTYLASLEDHDLDRDFSFQEQGTLGFLWNIEGQIVQLFGHAPYHRGQIVMLVDQLGGDTVDTDYADWAAAFQPDRWKAIEWPPSVSS